MGFLIYLFSVSRPKYALFGINPSRDLSEGRVGQFFFLQLICFVTKSFVAHKIFLCFAMLYTISLLQQKLCRNLPTPPSTLPNKMVRLHPLNTHKNRRSIFFFSGTVAWFPRKTCRDLNRLGYTITMDIMV